MGQAVAISNREHSASELRRIASRHKDAEVVRRLLALAQVLDGQSRTEAARQNGMDCQTLCDWVHRYHAAGVAGLASRVPPGSHAAAGRDANDGVGSAGARRPRSRDGWGGALALG